MLKEIYIENKNKIIIAIVLFIIFLFILIYSNINKKDIIYTKKTVGESILPYININKTEFSKINEDLNNRFEMITKKNNGSYMKYQYYKNKEIVSLVIETGIKSTEDDVLEIEYETYNINLSGKKLMNFDELIEKYDLNKEILKQRFDIVMEDEYKKETSNYYVDSIECTYECFIELKNYNSLEENLQMYVKDNYLYAYLNLQDYIIIYNKDDYPTMDLLYKLT